MDRKPTKVCIYALLHKTTEPALKVNIDVFKDSSGENAWNLVPSESLLPGFKNVPANALYKSVETKFYKAYLSLFGRCAIKAHR